jgi:molybdopterin molybdotransferase
VGEPPPVGRDVRRAGGECRTADVVLAAGALVRPAAIGMLAAAGLDRVTVRRVAADVLVLGDELLTSGPARAGRLRDALGPLLTAWLPASGIAVASRRHVPDTAEALAVALSGCLADVVVTTGSTARGPVDHLHAVLDGLGARLVVDGVAVRPGHPQLLAVLPDGRPLVGLPGNPLAAVSGLLTLLLPVLRGLRAQEPDPVWLGALAVDVGAGHDATRLVPVRDGVPVLYAGPGMLRGLASAQAVAVVPPGGVRAGQDVELLALP